MTVTHIVTDTNYKPIAVASTLSEAQGYAGVSIADGTEAWVWPLDNLDLATVAQIAAADNPKLTAVGTDWIGAGTHPAQPYLSAMYGMHHVTRENYRQARYGSDTVAHVLAYFLENVSAWRGPTAKAIKATLRGWK